MHKNLEELTQKYIVDSLKAIKAFTDNWKKILF